MTGACDRLVQDCRTRSVSSERSITPPWTNTARVQAFRTRKNPPCCGGTHCATNRASVSGRTTVRRGLMPADRLVRTTVRPACREGNVRDCGPFHRIEDAGAAELNGDIAGSAAARTSTKEDSYEKWSTRPRDGTDASGRRRRAVSRPDVIAGSRLFDAVRPKGTGRTPLTAPAGNQQYCGPNYIFSEANT